MNEDNFLLFSDNGIKGHIHSGGQGIICSAFALFNDTKLVCEKSVVEENVTNNYGELKAIKIGLMECISRGIKILHIFSDSELSVKWINGEYEARSENIIPILSEIKELMTRFESCDITWIKRDLNIYADLLTIGPLDQYRKTKKKAITKERALQLMEEIIPKILEGENNG